MKPCTIEGCHEAHHARGWCRTHYRRWQRHGDPERHEEHDNGCGTYAGYMRHHKAGETTCRPCRDAMNAYNRARRANMPKRPKPLARNVPAGTPRCEGCTRPMVGRSTTKANLPEGWARRHNDTTCTACYDKARRERKAAQEAEAQAPVIADPALEAMMRKRAERLAREQRIAQIRRPAA